MAARRGFHLSRIKSVPARLTAALVLFGVLFLAAPNASAQACSVVGSGATNAAGNSIPIWSCSPDADNAARAYVPQPLPDVWGAIAISTSLKWGISWNYKSEADAKAAALKSCKAVSNVKDCKIAVTVADVCVSLALSKPERLYAVGGPTGAVNYADMNANLHCQRAGGRSCAIATSFCADGIRHVLQDKDNAAPFGRIRR